MTGYKKGYWFVMRNQSIKLTIQFVTIDDVEKAHKEMRKRQACIKLSIPHTPVAGNKIKGFGDREENQKPEKKEKKKIED